jgi:SAM-dependent methyltransferase
MNASGDWSRGYPVAEPYPPSWHGFLSPAHLRTVFALMGVAWEVDADTPLQIADIGCGTGYSTQVLAAGNPGCQVVGLDYNPGHIAEARSIAREARLDNLRFIEADLAEADTRLADELPDLDLVTVHGLWSWVDDSVREGVLRLLRRRLKPGGVVLLSYNALPGAAGSLGLARLVRSPLQSAADPREGLARAARLVERLVAAEPAHLPTSGWRRMLLGETKGARPGYLMHEFQTAHWRPAFHADVAAAMSEVRCEYVGSATIDENFPQMSLSPEQRVLWEEAGDAASRELVFDLCVPRAFRRDVFVRGLRRVPRDPTVEALTFIETTQVRGEPVLRTQSGEARLPADLAGSLREALRRGPATIRELRALPGCGRATPSELVALLIGSGCAMPQWGRSAGGDRPSLEALTPSRRLNAVAARRLAHDGFGVGQLALATPVLSGGLPASMLELAVVDKLNDGADENSGHLAQSLIRTQVPEVPLSVQDDLQSEIQALLEERLPIWRSLGIVNPAAVPP